MILSTHIVGAAAAVKLLGAGHPVAVFGVALASHYLFDAIPHWDYKLHSLRRGMKENSLEVTGIDKRIVWKDIARVFFDIFIGAAIIYFLYGPATSFYSLFVPSLIICGAIFPDMLQPPYWFYKKPPMTHIHRFHSWMHAKQKLSFSFFGVGSQTALQILFLFILFY